MKKELGGEKIAALRSFMERRGLKPHPWAQSAGIRSSTLYNFLAGKSATLSSETLERLAQAAGASVDEILGREGPRPTGGAGVPLRYTVGILGRLFVADVEEVVARPAGVPSDVDLVAARIDGDGLSPLRAGWIVYFEAVARDPSTLSGKLAVVRLPGKPAPLVREIRRGSQAGLFTLLAWTGSPIEDVEVEAAHLVVSIAQPA